MNLRNLFMSSFALAAMTLTVVNINASNITASAARNVANNYFKQAVVNTSLRGVASSDLILVHSEASKAVAGANDYYVFNIKGGGFILIAGEDRATQVLGYSENGRFDINNLPTPLKDLLSGYQLEIEFLQTYTGNDLIPAPVPSINAGTTVEPLIKTTWGQEDPYDWQCPVYQGEYCVVGCVATAMAQVMNYWQFPEGSSSLARFHSSGYGYVDALPATTFDYNLMLDSYCHWDWDQNKLIQDTYTDAQAQEVAKLGRYCGQAVQMSYSPEGSGAYTDDQWTAMKNFGFRSSAQHLQKGGWYSSYSTAQWEAKIKAELDAGRPILYSASDPSAGGHAFICDGYNADGKFHFNFGWYGTCDGWYVSTALNMTHREGDELHFNSSHEMLIGIEPPEGWVPPTHTILGDVNDDGIISIKDVTDLIDYLLTGNAKNLDFTAADIDSNNEISIKDVTDLIDLLLDN